MKRDNHSLGLFLYALLCTALSLFSALPIAAEDEPPVPDVPPILQAMSPGWNLGNTLDAVGKGLKSETSWGQPRTTQAMIAGLRESGILTVRLPVSWAGHIDKNGKIDSKWMARVREVVDWCIGDGLFVIVNIHHDNTESEGQAAGYRGYYPTTRKLDTSIQFVTAVWSQVASTFRDYDEHLIFETLNEPRLRGTNIEWWNHPGDKKAQDAAHAVNELNQAAVNAIRQAGGKNVTRYIMCPALRASVYDALGDDFVLPQDALNPGEKSLTSVDGVAPGRILVSVHAYIPNDFAMASPGETQFTEAHEKDLNQTFADLEAKFTSQGIGVVIGEYGATNKDNLAERVKWFRCITGEAAKRGIPLCLWDNGAYQTTKGPDGYAERFGYYDRKNQTWYFPEILDVLTGK